MHNWHCIHCIKGIACINGIVNSNSMTWDAHMAMNALLVLCRFNTQHCNTQIRNKQTSKAHHLVIVKLLIICWSFDDHLFVIQWQTNKQANEQSDHWFLIISLSSKDLIIVWPVISNHLLNIWWSSICYSMTKNKQTNLIWPLSMSFNFGNAFITWAHRLSYSLSASSLWVWYSTQLVTVHWFIRLMAPICNERVLKSVCFCWWWWTGTNFKFKFTIFLHFSPIYFIATGFNHLLLLPHHVRN